jgi:hypothetical protein
MQKADFSEANMEQAAWFALRMRHAIRNPEIWRNVIMGAKTLLELSGARVEDNPEDDVALLAVAYIAARRCARELPPADPLRVECEELLDGLASMVA